MMRLRFLVAVRHSPSGPWTTLAKFLNEGDARDFAFAVCDKAGPDVELVRVQSERRNLLVINVWSERRTQREAFGMGGKLALEQHKAERT